MNNTLTRLFFTLITIFSSVNNRIIKSQVENPLEMQLEIANHILRERESTDVVLILNNNTTNQIFAKVGAIDNNFLEISNLSAEQVSIPPNGSYFTKFIERLIIC